MTVTVEKLIKTIAGKEIEVTVTKHIGRAIYETKRGPIEADEYIECDYGPKRGIAKSYAHYPEGGLEALERSKEEFRQLAGRLAAYN